jgi:hypothetical protein
VRPLLSRCAGAPGRHPRRHGSGHDVVRHDDRWEARQAVGPATRRRTGRATATACPTPISPGSSAITGTTTRSRRTRGPTGRTLRGADVEPHRPPHHVPPGGTNGGDGGEAWINRASSSSNPSRSATSKVTTPFGSANLSSPRRRRRPRLYRHHGFRRSMRSMNPLRNRHVLEEMSRTARPNVRSAGGRGPAASRASGTPAPRIVHLTGRERTTGASQRPDTASASEHGWYLSWTQARCHRATRSQQPTQHASAGG